LNNLEVDISSVWSSLFYQDNNRVIN